MLRAQSSYGSCMHRLSRPGPGNGVVSYLINFFFVCEAKTAWHDVKRLSSAADSDAASKHSRATHARTLIQLQVTGAIDVNTLHDHTH